jgi:HPt (histidine-containing phosphotransfer) domain-containing protein
MASKKEDAPSVATFADHEVIMPPHRLRHAVSPASPDGHDDPVARAEQALAKLSPEFANWMDIECGRLDAARKLVQKQGLDDKTRDPLFHAAHDIKGEAATFGYPQAAAVAESLCRLIEHTPDMTRIPLALIDQHVDAVRAIVREHARPDADEIGGNLIRRLRTVTDDFLLEENKDRLDELEGILSPPIAPNEAAG